MRDYQKPKQIDRRLAAMRKLAPSCAFNNVRLISRAIERIYDTAFRPVGLSASQVSLLWSLLSTGPISLKKLSEILQADPTTISRVVKLAHQKGLVTQERQSHDHRLKSVLLTAEGRAKLAEVWPLWKLAQVEAGLLVNLIGLQNLSKFIRGKQKNFREN